MLESSDWMEEEKKEDNKMAISRERESLLAAVGSIHRRKWVTFSSIYE